MYVWATVCVYVYMCTSAMTRSLCKCTSHPIIYDVWLRHSAWAKCYYIRYRRLGLTLSVWIWWAVNDRYMYNVLIVPVELNILWEENKGRYSIWTLVLSVRIPFRCLLQLVPWPGSWLTGSRSREERKKMYTALRHCSELKGTLPRGNEISHQTKQTKITTRSR